MGIRDPGPWKRSVPKERGVVPAPSVQRQAIQVREVHQHKASREASPVRDDPICELHHPRGAELLLLIVRKILTTRDTGENIDAENCDAIWTGRCSARHQAAH